MGGYFIRPNWYTELFPIALRSRSSPYRNYGFYLKSFASQSWSVRLSGVPLFFSLFCSLVITFVQIHFHPQSIETKILRYQRGRAVDCLNEALPIFFSVVKNDFCLLLFLVFDLNFTFYRPSRLLSFLHEMLQRDDGFKILL